MRNWTVGYKFDLFVVCLFLLSTLTVTISEVKATETYKKSRPYIC